MDLSVRCCLTHTLTMKKKRKTAASPAAPRLPSQGTGAAVSTLADGWRRSYGPNTSRGSARLSRLPSRRLWSSRIRCCLTHTLIMIKKRKTVACPAVLRLPFHGAGTVVSTFATATAPSRCAYYPAQHLQQKKRSPIADACAQVVNTD